jgi:hypothetical protein
MVKQYAKDQPEGFVNYIQNVAIVGVSVPYPGKAMMVANINEY